MSTDIKLVQDEHMPSELVLRHERELSQLSTVTNELKKQNESIIEGIEYLKISLTDIKSDVNRTMHDINTNIVSLKKELQEKEKRIEQLEDSTSHLGWLNKSIKITVDKVGTIMIAAVLAIIISHWETLSKLLSLFK